MRHKLQDISIEEYTSPDPVTVGLRTPKDELLRLLHASGFRHLPVVDQDRIVGIISDRDILLSQAKSPPGSYAGDIMTPNPYTVTLSASLGAVVLELSKRKVGSAIVTEANGALYGIFTVTDALNALVEVLRGEVEGA